MFGFLRRDKENPEVKDQELNAENIAVVAHAGLVRILKSVIEKVAISELFENFKPAYASVTVFEINKND